MPTPHDGLDKQIATATDELRQSPGNEALLIRRSDLYRRHGQWNEAFRDQAQVQEQRESQAFVVARTLLFRDLGCLRAGQVLLDSYLKRDPDDAGIRVLRSEILEQRGLLLAALDDLNLAIPRLAHPEPDHYVARARIAAACPELGERAAEVALHGLDEGIVELGLLASLQLTAIELERGRERFDLALDRLETIRVSSARQETWLHLRGNLLSEAGRTVEAKQSYEESLVAIRRLRPKHRMTPEIRALERALLNKLDILAPPAEGPVPNSPPLHQQK